ncbi:hypothetical protein Gogos_019084 [Gossypium gossypioides]|uniref:RNase H type-1 domain-containing protein n=1 Tax=Gossypium gossypioides TaxID=34282 RepID=A0A7J9BGC7_GOSGO|nr:hypothetical protein [Gossypium gossypioides]
MALTEKEGNVVIKSGKNEKIQDTQQRKGKEIVIEGNQGAGASMYNVGHFSRRSRDTTNVLGLKNVATPSRSSNNAGGLDNGLVSFSNLLIRNLVASRNQGRIADGGNDGSYSHSHIAGDGNKPENMEQVRLPSERVVDVTVSKAGDGLDSLAYLAESISSQAMEALGLDGPILKIGQQDKGEFPKQLKLLDFQEEFGWVGRNLFGFELSKITHSSFFYVYLDLGFISPSFTWQRANTSKILDRALANDSWILAFPQCIASHLPMIKSDHRPILLRTNLNISLAIGRPVRFLTGWTKHANFPSLVKDKWQFSGNMASSLSEFTSHVKECNRNISRSQLLEANVRICGVPLKVERAMGNASAGGVISDQIDNWILGYNQLLGNCTPFEAEFWVLRRVQRILRSEGKWWIRIVPRETNLIADRLAKVCLTWKSSLQIFGVALYEVIEALQQDKACGAFEHLS